MHLSITTTTLLAFFARPISATVGILNIDALLHQHHIAHLHNPAEYQPYHPWSHKPHCEISKSSSHIGQKFCVYTSNTTGPDGLSLILNQKHAKKAAQHIFSSSPNSFIKQHNAATLQDSHPPWKVMPIPGKGHGVIATRRIEKYETFMLDHAALILDSSVSSASLLGVAVNQLRTFNLVLNMSSAHADLAGQGTLEQNILRTNGFGTHIAGVSTRSLYPLISVRRSLPTL
jgi:hypothetical protein